MTYIINGPHFLNFSSAMSVPPSLKAWQGERSASKLFPETDQIKAYPSALAHQQTSGEQKTKKRETGSCSQKGQQGNNSSAKASQKKTEKASSPVVSRQTQTDQKADLRRQADLNFFRGRAETNKTAVQNHVVVLLDTHEGNFKV